MLVLPSFQWLLQLYPHRVVLTLGYKISKTQKLFLPNPQSFWIRSANKSIKIYFWYFEKLRNDLSPIFWNVAVLIFDFVFERDLPRYQLEGFQQTPSLSNISSCPNHQRDLMVEIPPKRAQLFYQGQISSLLGLWVNHACDCCCNICYVLFVPFLSWLRTAPCVF